MGDVLKEGQFDALMRRLDDLLAEAVRLRHQIGDAMRRDRQQPFWPDRRRTRQPHEPDRRRNG